MSETRADEWVLTVEGLGKSFGHNHALRGVNLRLKRGEFLTILGPNGAGKTTLIRILATLTKPSRGKMRLGSWDLRQGGVALRREIGFLSHQTLLYDDLTAFENLHFYGRMYDVPNLEKRIQEVIRRVGLERRLHDPVRTFSRGMQQRLAIARAFLHEPSLMLLDEPYTGLDQSAVEMLRGILQELAGGQKSVIMATHNLEQGLENCHRLAILVRGEIKYEADRGSLDLDALRQVYRRTVGDEIWVS